MIWSPKLQQQWSQARTRSPPNYVASHSREISPLSSRSQSGSPYSHVSQLSPIPPPLVSATGVRITRHFPEAASTSVSFELDGSSAEYHHSKELPAQSIAIPVSSGSGGSPPEDHTNNLHDVDWDVSPMSTVGSTPRQIQIYRLQVPTPPPMRIEVHFFSLDMCIVVSQACMCYNRILTH